MTDVHGGNIYRILKNNKVKTIIDFSINLNPCGISRDLLNYLKKEIHAVIHYPDPEYHQLYDVLSQYTRMERQNIFPGNGATDIIYRYVQNLSIKNPLIISPTFCEYERALCSRHIPLNFFQLHESENFELHLKSLYSRIDGYDLIFICNPNNPTGGFIEPQVLLSFAKACMDKNINIFIDESFIEFVTDYKKYTIVNYIDDLPNVFVLRSLTKFFAIPGLRIGYGISAHTELLERMKLSQPEWNINFMAEKAVCYMLNNKAYINASHSYITEQRNKMYEELSKINNLKIYISHSGYFLIKILNHMTAEELQNQLIKDKHILIRDCSNFQFLDNKFFRIALHNKRNNKKMIQGLTDIFDNK